MRKLLLPGILVLLSACSSGSEEVGVFQGPPLLNRGPEGQGNQDPSPCLPSETVLRFVVLERTPYTNEQLVDCRSMASNDLTWCCPM